MARQDWGTRCTSSRSGCSLSPGRTRHLTLGASASRCCSPRTGRVPVKSQHGWCDPGIHAGGGSVPSKDFAAIELGLNVGDVTSGVRVRSVIEGGIKNTDQEPQPRSCPPDQECCRLTPTNSPIDTLRNAGGSCDRLLGFPSSPVLSVRLDRIRGLHPQRVRGHAAGVLQRVDCGSPVRSGPNPVVLVVGRFDEGMDAAAVGIRHAQVFAQPVAVGAADDDA